MKTTGWILVAAAIASVAAGPASLAEEKRTLIGEYVWNNRNTGGDLEAIFTPTGDGTWDVAFHFTFRGQPHVYSGTAEGSLTEGGGLKGTVLNEDKSRKFTFGGKFEHGEFRGDHAEITGGREIDTGTLRLGG
jgi:hypothetical protein